jgi:hypothetical protein
MPHNIGSLWVLSCFFNSIFNGRREKESDNYIFLLRRVSLGMNFISYGRRNHETKKKSCDRDMQCPNPFVS